MKALMNSEAYLKICYSEAAVYHPSEAEFLAACQQNSGNNDSLGLDEGLEEVFIPPEFSGSHHESHPNSVILFPSFNASRSKGVQAHIDPTLLVSKSRKIYWLIGKPHLSKDTWRLDAMRKINHLSPDAFTCHDVSTFDYKEALTRCEKIYEDVCEECNVTLIPFGSKMQTIAAAFFLYLHPDVRVILAKPKRYKPSRYTEGCAQQWQVEIKETGLLRKTLNNLGQFVIE